LRHGPAKRLSECLPYRIRSLRRYLRIEFFFEKGGIGYGACRQLLTRQRVRPHSGYGPGGLRSPRPWCLPRNLWVFPGHHGIPLSPDCRILQGSGREPASGDRRSNTAVDPFLEAVRDIFFRLLWKNSGTYKRRCRSMIYKDILNSGNSERLKYQFRVYKASDQKKKVNVSSNGFMNSFVFESIAITHLNRNFSTGKDFFNSGVPAPWIQWPFGIS
jgi:hypothetical protein